MVTDLLLLLFSVLIPFVIFGSGLVWLMSVHPVTV